jgi:hypothetical protein
MKSRQELIEDLIVKLSFSSLPPFIQEELLNHIASIVDSDLKKISTLLDGLSNKEADYLTQADKYTNFYNELSKHLESKFLDEIVKIQEELKKEMVRNDLKINL